ncbi:ATP-binding protein [Virgibacillus sp. CBA3643]
MSFSNFDPRKGSEDAQKEVKDAVENFKDRGKLGVFIFGETGNGKSHLTASGGNELINKGYAVIYITEKDLFSRLQATKNFKNEESFQEIMGACLEADLLIWDDFMSSQNLRPEEKDWIFQIINGRERANKPIWATSNITPKEFESEEIAYKLDDKGRTWWRILGNMNCVFNRATNYRKSKAMSRAMGISIEEYEAGKRG